MIMRIFCTILAKRPPDGKGIKNSMYYFVERLARKYFAFRRKRNELFPFSSAEIKCVFPQAIKRDVLAWVYGYWQWLDAARNMEPENKTTIAITHDAEILSQALADEGQQLLKIREEQ